MTEKLDYSKLTFAGIENIASEVVFLFREASNESGLNGNVSSAQPVSIAQKDFKLELDSLERKTMSYINCWGYDNFDMVDFYSIQGRYVHMRKIEEEIKNYCVE